MKGALVPTALTFTPHARLVVFVDYQNLHGAALQSFWPQGTHPAVGHVDPLNLGQFLAARRTANGYPSTLTGVRVYRGRPSSTRMPAAAAIGSA
ncbi:hypothetical protein [Microtetraspora fusca]|uniref:hypothetical protein n=1 Tax=Microtetraspora fusca TaxID=1997 RepID=UPI000A7C5B99|nr:hypothetical protein [Microtetraspora fusca]